VVPESMKMDKVIPSKLAKGKVLLFVKLRACMLKGDSMQKNVRYENSDPKCLLLSDFKY